MINLDEAVVTYLEHCHGIFLDALSCFWADIRAQNNPNCKLKNFLET